MAPRPAGVHHLGLVGGLPCPAYCLYIAAVVRVQWRVRRESRPASAHIQEELVRVSRAMEWGVPDIAATEEFLPDEVRVMPSLPGPASVAVGPCMLLLGREDYDAETLEAIFRHELAHTHGVKATGLRSMCAIMSAIFWFLPPVWMLKREMRVREEFICDRDANLGCTLEKRRAYARAMASLAADRKRELPGTAGMACGAATLRRRVEALFRPEKPQGGWRDMLYNVVLCPPVGAGNGDRRVCALWRPGAVYADGGDAAPIHRGLFAGTGHGPRCHGVHIAPGKRWPL